MESDHNNDDDNERIDDVTEEDVVEEEIENESAQNDDEYDVDAVVNESNSPDAIRKYFKMTSDPDKVTAYRPNINHLKDAIEYDATGKPTFLAKVGDKVVVEYGYSLWRDTEMLEVEQINVENGDVRCWNYVKKYYSPINFVQAKDYKLTVKFADKIWLSGRRPRATKKKGRGAVAMNPEILQAAQQVKVVVPSVVVEGKTVSSSLSTVKKKRGRPKGSLNKSTLARLAASSTIPLPVKIP